MELTHSQTGPKGIDLEEMIRLRKKGLSYAEIGKLCNCSSTNVYLRLNRYADDIEELEEWKASRADIYASKVKLVLSKIRESTLDKCSGKDLAIISGILHDHELKERGIGNTGPNNITLVIKGTNNEPMTIDITPGQVAGDASLQDDRGDT